MCLILLAFKKHPLFRLIIAANRDEYYERPSAPPGFWEDAPEVLAGRDLRAGGTWLGITRKGRIAAITNYRDPASTKKNAPSRGRLVSDFLMGNEAPDEYLRRVSEQGDAFNGFNLVVGEGEDIRWYSNRGGRVIALRPGLYGISNRLLDTPWPKVERGKQQMEDLLRREAGPSPEELFQVLQDRTVPCDDRLPDTGVGLEWERMLSPSFVSSPIYGTRSSTLIFVEASDRVTFLDRTFNSHPDPLSTTEFRFQIQH